MPTTRKPAKKAAPTKLRPRSKAEIAAEIDALKALRNKVPPFTAFGDDNREAITAQIIVLENRMTDAQILDRYEGGDDEDPHILASVLSARDWLWEDGESMSEGWAYLAEDSEEPDEMTTAVAVLKTRKPSKPGKKHRPRTEAEVEAEISLLKALRDKVPPFTAFGDDNRVAIDITVSILESRMAPTAVLDKYKEDDNVDAHSLSAALDAREWLWYGDDYSANNGGEIRSPSDGWAHLAEKKAA